MNKADVNEVVAKARKAQAAWSRTTFAERRRVMRMLNAAILLRQDQILDASIRDSGKTYMDGILGEIMTTLEKIAWINREGEQALKPSYRNTSLMMMHKVRGFKPTHRTGLCLVGHYAPLLTPSVVLCVNVFGAAVGVM